MTIEMANRLVGLRKAKGLSQEELAEQVGVSRQAVSKWERAEASPDLDKLILLSRLYRMTLDELLFQTGEKTASEDENEIADSPDSDDSTDSGADDPMSGDDSASDEESRAEPADFPDGGEPKTSVHISFHDGIHIQDKKGDRVHIDLNDIRIDSSEAGAEWNKTVSSDENQEKAWNRAAQKGEAWEQTHEPDWAEKEKAWDQAAQKGDAWDQAQESTRNETNWAQAGEADQGPAGKQGGSPKEKASVHVSFRGGIHVKDENGDEVHIGRGEIHVDSHEGDNVHVDRSGVIVNGEKKRLNRWYHFPFPILAFLLFLGWGFSGVFYGWKLSWMSFLTIPLYYSLVSAIDQRKPMNFAYPVVAVIVFFLWGFSGFLGGWMTSWLIFLTIPLYYTAFEAVKRRKPMLFCYPVLMAILFFAWGFSGMMGGFTLAWIVFLTIPIFYWACGGQKE